MIFPWESFCHPLASMIGKVGTVDGSSDGVRPLGDRGDTNLGCSGSTEDETCLELG